MSDSPETVVRRFLAAFPKSDVDELISFFSDDAVYINGPRPAHHGIDAIRSEFVTQVQMVPSTTVDITTFATNADTVTVERVEHCLIQGVPVDHEVVGVFEVDDAGRITRWRDYYDLTSLVDRIASSTASPNKG